MSPSEIEQAYDVLAQNVRDDMAAQAAKVGNSQRSIGGLAEVVANPSGQTSGLANYTYNRLLRPSVDTMATQLTTQGKVQALSKELGDRLREAKNNYERAKNRYTSTPTSTGSNGYYKYNEPTVTDSSVKAVVQSIIPYGVIDGIQYMYNPETGNVVINGQELNMTPEQYVQTRPTVYGGGGSGYSGLGSSGGGGGTWGNKQAGWELPAWDSYGIGGR